MENKRGANFTKSEINTLVDIALNYKHIIENKRTDGTTSQEKNKTWDIIAEQFNSASGNFARSAKTIRTKYDALKKDLGKNCSKLKNEQIKTGGRIPSSDELLSYEEIFLAVCKTSMIGLNSQYDDDANEAEAPPNQEMRTTTCTNPNKVIEYLYDDTEDVLTYLQEKGELSILSGTINNEPPTVCSEIPSASPKEVTEEYHTTPHINSRKKASSASVFNKYPSNIPTKASRRHQKGNKLENETTAEVVRLKKQLLQLQIDLVQKEIEQKDKIASLTIENLLLDQAIKKAQLKEFNFT